MHIKRIIGVLFMALMFAIPWACGAEDTVPTEDVGEAEQEVVGASCSALNPCTGYPPQNCCSAHGGSICRAECDDSYCGGCSLNCTSQGKHCMGGQDGHCPATCVECNTNGQCSGGKTCVSSSCVCPAGQTDCSGTCYDLQITEAHCGSCPNACGAGQACVAGSCFGCPGGVCTGCSTNNDCPFKTKCESAVCTGHCIDHTGCPDNQLCISSVCTSVNSVGANQTEKDTYCRNTYDNGTNPSNWMMKSCSDKCVQTIASGTNNNAVCGSNWGSLYVANYGLLTGSTAAPGSCTLWEGSSCFTAPNSGIPKANCRWKVFAASGCNDYW
jgi:hypothetical protein